MADKEPRELFPVTFFNGGGPVVMGGTDFSPKLEYVSADNPTSPSEDSEEGADNHGQASSDQTETTALETAEKPKKPAPD